MRNGAKIITDTILLMKYPFLSLLQFTFIYGSDPSSLSGGKAITSFGGAACCKYAMSRI
jgi:hypothetical protein